MYFSMEWTVFFRGENPIQGIGICGGSSWSEGLGLIEGMVQMGMKGKLKPDKNRKQKISCPDVSKPEA